MSKLNLSTTTETFGSANDSVAIKKYIHGKEGGQVLFVHDYPDDYIYAGHGVIIEQGFYKPQPTDGTKEDMLVGVVKSTTKASKPSTSIMTLGVINNNALKYPFNEAALAKLASLGIQNQVD